MTPAKASTLGLILVLLLCAPVPSVSAATESAGLHVALRPEVLGGQTTILFSFRISTPGREAPAPLTAVSLAYPANIGLVTSGLGLETCDAAQLEAQGRCPPDSLMGYGRALVELPIGPEAIPEEGEITTWMAPLEHGHLALLFYAEGQTPVKAGLIFTAQLLAAPQPFGGRLVTSIPIIPTLPEAPDAAVVQMTSTIGPMNVTYYAQFRGRRVAYHPAGLLLPSACPRGGFPFAATFTFLNGSHASARASVPCPGNGSRRR